jgi:tRNA(Ile)-lysidine synthase
LKAHGNLDYHPTVLSLTARVAQAIERHALLTPGDRVVVAVSGGLDSIVLLRVLRDLSTSRSWGLVVAHFDHQLRGSASRADARFVKCAAEALDLQLLHGQGDVARFARDQKISVEMGARVLRHRFLARASREAKAAAVALAHHADDQVELFFLRLFRGAGVEGLSGMDWSGISPEDRGVRLIRPLLEERREALARYARERRIAYREDASNRSLDIMRNRIRHELLPELRRRYQASLEAVVLRTMVTLRDTASFVAEQAQAWRRARRKKPFVRQPIALQRYILSIQLRELKVPVDFDLVERLRLASGERVSAGTGRFLSRDPFGTVVQTTGQEFGTEEAELRLGEGRGASRFGGMELRWRVVSLRRARRGSGVGEAQTEVFDADKVGSVIVLRHWRRGDRFQPSGLGRPAKLQNLFVNRRIPRDGRHQLVIATTAKGTIFWVEGLRISEGFKLDKTSKHGLKWVWHRMETS